MVSLEQISDLNLCAMDGPYRLRTQHRVSIMALLTRRQSSRQRAATLGVSCGRPRTAACVLREACILRGAGFRVSLQKPTLLLHPFA